MKRKFYTTLIALLLIIGLSTPVYAQMPSQLWVNLYFKSVRLLGEANENIKKLEAEIRENQNAISRAENIINLARQRTDAKAKEAERIAQEALMKAKEALRRNETSLAEWKLKRTRAQNALAAIQNMNRSTFDSKVKGFVSDHSGRVEILKANGNTEYLDGNSSGLLESGDSIITYGNGTAQVQFLDGRANSTLAPDTQITIKKDEPAEQILGLLKGRIYTAVDKIDDFTKKMKEEYQRYREDLKTIGEYLKDEDLRKQTNRQLSIEIDICRPLKKKITALNVIVTEDCVITPIAVAGIRGTKFVLENTEEGNGELYVIEGVVDVTTPDGKTFIVSGGYKTTFREGRFSEAQRFGNIDKWWER